METHGTTVGNIIEFASQANNGSPKPARILVINDVEETRDGLERLLTSDGYRVDTARDEEKAAPIAKLNPPTLVLLSPREPQNDWIASAGRLREAAGLDASVPVVFFCVETIAESAEVRVEGNTYLIRPDNFNQLRQFIGRLLRAAEGLG